MQNVLGNLTINNLVEDANKALAVLINQPKVDANKITVLGHSEGTTISPRVAIANPSKVRNIVLMGAEYKRNTLLPNSNLTYFICSKSIG